MYNRLPNHKYRFFIIVLVIGFIGIIYKFHKKQENLQNEIISLQEAQIVKETESVKYKSVLAEQDNKQTWTDIQKRIKDAVIQIFVQQTSFNWIEPYKTPRIIEAFGSGFFINDNGDILTNYHVVEEASSIQIQIPSLGKQQLDVEIIGVSPDRDIALLRLTTESKNIIKQLLGSIPYIEFGNSDALIRTQEVLALGYPLGQQTLKSTQGIVSGREMSYIQITAPLNPGISGGPSLNTEGKVIGINTCGFPDAQNVGYIIPISEIKSAVNDLYKVKLLRRPLLGGIFIPTTQDLVQFLKNPGEGGWYVSRVLENSSLDKVGLCPGDMIYEINGHKVDKYGEVSVGWAEEKVSVFALLNRYIVGDKVHLVVYRKGERKDFRFELQATEMLPVRKIFPEFEKVDYEVFGGMVVMELTLNHVFTMIQGSPNFIKFTKPGSQDKSYLVITKVLPNSAAAKVKCLFSGSILDTVNGHKVRTLNDFRESVLKHNSKYISVQAQDPVSETVFAVLPIDKILKQEDELSRRYFYPKSVLLNNLAKGFNV